jgi:hypothetical protein
MATEETKDDLDINLDAFGNDEPAAESKITVPLEEDDLEHSQVLTADDIMTIVKTAMAESGNAGARPNYPIHNPVGMPKQGVRSGQARQPIGQYNILEVDEKDPNMVYRWVNDKDDGQRVQRFINAGYVPVVKPSAKAYDKRAGSDSQMGSSIIRSVGGGTRGVLMMIRKDWYEEDQRAKQTHLDKIESKISKPYNPNDERMPDPTTGEYGSVRITHK